MLLHERLNPASYAADEPVGIVAVARAELPGPLPDDLWRYIPERLWKRILGLAAAYELHVAQVLEPIIDTVLNGEQCASVAEELGFLGEVIKDPATNLALATIIEVLTTAARGRDLAVVFSPP